MKPYSIIFLLLLLVIVVFMSCQQIITITKIRDKVATPVFSPISGIFGEEQSIQIDCSTDGVSIYYTTDGTTPSKENGTLYTGKFTVSYFKILKAIAYKEGMTPSNIARAAYSFEVAKPIIKINSTPVIDGTYSFDQSVSISTTTSGAKIYYTLDGSSPSSSSLLYSTPLSINKSLTIKAIAYKSYWAYSGVWTANITLKVDSPSFYPLPGEYDETIDVIISPSILTASTKYTTDSKDSIPTVDYTTPLTISSGTTIKAYSFVSGMTDSSIAIGTYNFKVKDLLISPAGGNYSSSQNVTISSPTPGITIRYTTDGTTPRSDYGTIYSGPITITDVTNDCDAILKAIGYKTGLSDSTVETENYYIGDVTSDTADPTISNSSNIITIDCSTPSAFIKYTTDGSIPSETNGFFYSSPFSITETTTIKAFAYKSGLGNSNVTSQTYTIANTVEPVVFDLSSGTYYSSKQLQLSTSTSGATIFYTTNGSDPTADSNSFVYYGPISLARDTNSSITIKARAIKSGWTASEITTATYTFVLPEPVLNPPAGTYNTTPEVIISEAVLDSTVRYTTDGSDPTVDSTLYNDGDKILPTNGMTIKVIAFKTAWETTEIISATYVLQTASPTFYPETTKTYTQAIEVTLRALTSGATIRYTTDGTEPTKTSGTIYSGPFTITQSTTIKAIAYKSGWEDSTVSSASYSIQTE